MPSVEVTALALRRLVIERSVAAGVGHISSALCICDIMAVLFRSVLRDVGSRRPDRDRFILSKGHAALALYSSLFLRGVLSREQFDGYCVDGALLGVHPEHGIPGVEVSTGSLGLGLSIGAGMALSAKLRGQTWRTCVLLSDAECNEGMVWEAVMFAAHHRLSNLLAVVDDNGMQALGPTRDVLDLQPLEERWRAFGWDACTVDGHDEQALEAALAPAPAGGPPRVVIARTIAAKGVPFMERKLEWHYLPLSREQGAEALRELERGAP
jgi:transketolase